MESWVSHLTLKHPWITDNLWSLPLVNFFLFLSACAWIFTDYFSLNTWKKNLNIKKLSPYQEKAPSPKDQGQQTQGLKNAVNEQVLWTKLKVIEHKYVTHKMQHPGGGGYTLDLVLICLRLKLQEGHWGTERWKAPGFDYCDTWWRQAAFWACAIPLNELPEPRQENSEATEFIKGQEMKWTNLALQSLQENVPHRKTDVWLFVHEQISFLRQHPGCYKLWIVIQKVWTLVSFLLPIYDFWERCLVFLMVHKNSL